MNLFQKMLDNYMYRINFNRYWKCRTYISSTVGGLRRMWYLFYLKRAESQFGAHTGLGFGTQESPCCKISTELNLPHGLSGIIFARNVEFEGKATVFQHVTIAQDDPSKITLIGEGAILGAGCVILNNSRIGKNSSVGANAVVTHDVPDNAVVAGVPARIIRYGK